MSQYRVVYSLHVSEKMLKRKISRADVEYVLTFGEVIEYDPRESKSLLLGWCDQRPIHVVVITNDVNKTERIITAYEPDPRRWTNNFRRRK